MKYLLDTDICIYLIKKQPQIVIDRLGVCALHEVGISSITLAELEYGVFKSQWPEKNARALQEFLIPLQMAEFGAREASSYGQIRAHLEGKGKMIGSMDLLIAAHALSLGIVLVTNNIREFSRIPSLQLENWTR